MEVEPTLSGTLARLPRLARGTTVGRYLLLDELGEGGMGVVYKAYDPELDRQIALKLLHMEDAADALRERLLREAQALARLSHPNVIAVHDVGVFQGHVFIAVEFIAGKTLRQWVAAERRSERAILDVFLAAGEGLEAAHRVGLVHRDFKPDNVMVGDDGRVRVLDFGLARVPDLVGGAPAVPSSPGPGRTPTGLERTVGDRGSRAERTIPDRAKSVALSAADLTPSSSKSNRLSSPITRVGATIGTPRYMAPEQHLGVSIDAAADQFSFCVSLYNALYGVFPFAGKTEDELREEVLNGRIGEAPAGATTPGWLRAVILRGLSLAPAARFPSMTALLAALRADPRAARRRWLRGALVGLAAAAVAVAGVAGVLTWKTRHMLTERARLAQQFGQEAEKIAAISRHSAHLPLHDTRREREVIRARMERLKERMRVLGPVADGPGHEALGRGHLALERPDDALRELEAARASGYRSPELAFALGLVHGKLYQRALSEMTKTGDEKADAAQRQRLFEAHGAPALRYLQELARDHEASAVVDAPEYVEGLIAFYEKRFDAALVLARKTAERVLWQYEGLSLEGNIHLLAGQERYWRGDVDGALADLRRAGEAFRKASGVARSGAVALFGECQHQMEVVEILVDRDKPPQAAVKDALAACADAATARPDDSAPISAQALIWDSLANFQAEHAVDPVAARKEAIRLGERALTITARDLRAIDIISSAYLGLGERELERGGNPRPSLAPAIVHARRAIDIDPRFFDAYRVLGRTYSTRAAYEEAKGLDPRASYTAAIEYGSKGTELSPEVYNSWNTLGASYALLGTWKMTHQLDPTEEYTRAEASFAKVAKLSPTLDYGFSNLCEIHRCWGELAIRRNQDPRPRFEQAAASCRESIRTNANYAGSHSGLGNLYALRAGWELDHAIDPTPSLELAKAALDRSVEIDREHALAFEGLAESQLLAGRWAAANGRSPLAAFATAETLARKALAIRGEKSAETQRLLASIDRWRAEWLGRRHLDVGPQVREGLAAVKRARAENPNLATAAAVEGALHLMAARASSGPVERRAAAERARTAFDQALAGDAGLERDYRALADEAARLASAASP